MSVSVTKSGPYFVGAGTPVKWSDLRTYFKERSDGSVSASELFRDTREAERDPIVPDSTENTSIPVDTYPASKFSGNGTNWKASLMRNSIKRYTANQSGTDETLDLGLKSSTGGIDWDGTNNLDTEGKVTGNYTRNVQKIINITGTVYSNDSGINGVKGGGGVGKEKKPAAKLVLPDPLKGLNIRINVTSSGGIFGAGGLGGDFGSSPADKTLSDPGKNGGAALTVSHMGSVSVTTITNNGKIYGGGGGGEEGKMGAWPISAGTCTQPVTCSTTYNDGYGGVNGGCAGGTTCPAGHIVLANFRVDADECGPIYVAYCRQVITSCSGGGTSTSELPVQGRGGPGGDGASGIPGVPNYRPRQNGGAVSQEHKDAYCSSGQISGAVNSSAGSAGGNGGTWGDAGGSTLGVSPAATGLEQGEGGGTGGAAVCGKYYEVKGNTGAPHRYGRIDGLCNGEDAPEIPVGNYPVVTFPSTNYIRFNFADAESGGSGGTDKMLVTGTVRCRFLHEWSDLANYNNVALDAFTIKDNTGAVVFYSRVPRHMHKVVNTDGVYGELYDNEDDSVDFMQSIDEDGVTFTNKPTSTTWGKFFDYGNSDETGTQSYWTVTAFSNNNNPNTGWYDNPDGYSNFDGPCPIITLNESKSPFTLHFEGINQSNRSLTQDTLGTWNLMEAGQKIILWDNNPRPVPADTWVNQTIYILAENTTNAWVRSYPGPNGNTNMAGYQLWSQFMKDYAVWENNTDAKVGQEFTNSWSFNITEAMMGDSTNSAQYGKFELEVQSDNKCDLLFGGLDIGSTSEFGQHNTSKLIDLDCNPQMQSLTTICSNSSHVNPVWSTVVEDGYYPGQHYVAWYQGTFTIVYNNEYIATLTNSVVVTIGNMRYTAGNRAVDGGGWSQTSYYNIKVEQSNNIWETNPAGVAWVFRHKFTREHIFDSTEKSQGSLWGPAEISWNVTNIDTRKPTNRVQGWSTPNDPAFNIPNQDSNDGEKFWARPYFPTTYTIKGINEYGSGQKSITIN